MCSTGRGMASAVRLRIRPAGLGAAENCRYRRLVCQLILLTSGPWPCRAIVVAKSAPVTSPLHRLTKSHRAMSRCPGVPRLLGLETLQVARRSGTAGAPETCCDRASVPTRGCSGGSDDGPYVTLGAPLSRDEEIISHQQPYRTGLAGWLGWSWTGDRRQDQHERASSQLRHFIQCLRFPCKDFLTLPVARLGPVQSCRAVAWWFVRSVSQSVGAAGRTKKELLAVRCIEGACLSVGSDVLCLVWMP